MSRAVRGRGSHLWQELTSSDMEKGSYNMAMTSVAKLCILMIAYNDILMPLTYVHVLTSCLLT